MRQLMGAFALPLALLAGQAFAADYYVAPGGNDSDPGSEAEPWATIGKANTTLTAGDRVLIKAGTYSDQIRPVNNGTSDAIRITYQAFGDGDVTLTGFPGSTNPAEGAIALGQRDYITVSGRAPGDPATERRIRAIPTSYVNSYANFCGSEGSIMENVYMGGFSSSNCGSRGVTWCAAWWAPAGEAKYNVLRNSHIIGCVGAQYTEDLVRFNGDSHHNLIEDNIIENSNHGALYSETDTVHTNVVRDNIIRNVEHTALSIFHVDSAHWLIEGNVLWASGDNPSPTGGPGNSWQWGSGNQILRYNTITRGCAPNCNTDTFGAMSGSTGTSGIVYAAIDTRIYNNTIVKNQGSAVVQVWFSGGPFDLGRNKYVNNFMYDSQTPSSSGTLGYYRDTNLVPGGIRDRWINNVFGQPGQPSSVTIIQTPGGTYSLPSAIGSLTNPSEPEYTAWNGWSNTYDNAPAFTDYANDDFTLTAGSSAIDAGAPLTTVTSGCGGTVLTVDDARFFYDAATFPAWMGVEMDWVAVGATVAAATKQQLTAVNDDTNQLTFGSAVSCTNGDYVWLWKDSDGDVVVSGVAPDIGAFEFADTADAEPEWLIIPAQSTSEDDFPDVVPVAGYVTSNNGQPITGYAINPAVTGFSVNSSGDVTCDTGAVVGDNSIIVDATNATGTTPSAAFNWEVTLSGPPAPPNAVTNLTITELE